MKKKSTESSSATPSSRSKKPNLRNSKVQSPSPVKFDSKTPDKPPQRTRNRGVALSIAEIRNVAKGLQQDPKQNEETTPSQVKSARRQILQWPGSSSKSKNTDNDRSELPEKYATFCIFFFFNLYGFQFFVDLFLCLLWFVCRYKVLDEFFDRLDTLISIFRLKGLVSTFRKISSSIESLTERYRFFIFFSNIHEFYLFFSSVGLNFVYDDGIVCLGGLLMVI